MKTGNAHGFTNKQWDQLENFINAMDTLCEASWDFDEGKQQAPSKAILDRAKRALKDAKKVLDL